MQARTLIGIAVASLAVAVPVAQANNLTADGAAMPSAQSTPAAGQPYQAMANNANEQQRYPGTDAQQSPVRPDDRGGVRGIVEQPQAPVAVVSRPSNFGWTDFGLGSAAAVGILLALIAGRRLTSLTKPTPTKSLPTG